MSHRNARLTMHGRRLLVRRVREQGMAVAHVARAMGVSRQCAHRWVARFDAEGDAGLFDRSSRPRRMPTKTPAEVEAVHIPKGYESTRWAITERGVPMLIGPDALCLSLRVDRSSSCVGRGQSRPSRVRGVGCLRARSTPMLGCPGA